MEKEVCTGCGCEVELGQMVIEENVIGKPDHEVKTTARWFNAVCPKCGPILYDKRGHHGTVASKRLKGLFPKDRLRQLRSVLPEYERKLFNETLSGKRIEKDGEVQRWLEILERIPAGPRGLN